MPPSRTVCSVPYVDSGNAYEVSHAHGESALCDGSGAWLRWRPRSLPSFDCEPPTAACSGGVSAAGDTTRRAEPMRLGSFRTSEHWPGTASVDGFRDGVVVVATDLPALLSGCADGELPARPRRGVRGMGRIKSSGFI